VARYDPLDRQDADAAGVVGEAATYAERARRLGLAFEGSVRLEGDPAEDDDSFVDAIRAGVFAMSPGGSRQAYIAPLEATVPEVLHWLRTAPAARPRIRVTTPTAIRAALVAAHARRLAADAVGRLAKIRAAFSARQVATAGQMAGALLLALMLGAAGYLAPMATLFAVNSAGAGFFFSVSALRFIAAGQSMLPLPEAETDAAQTEDLPTYTILVPLHDEAAVLPELVAALHDIDWPADRLDIKLLLEEGDAATIAAARFAAPGAPFEILTIPPVGPLTKPKALAFALPLARGDFVTVYDAEDRPHRQQLREAWAAFCAAPDRLACLQSPLVIDNAGASWLSLSFAIEYAALFDGLLPALAALGMPLPLGGTSNHFRREALEAVGGWDPFNVTEDADLGLRLARYGYGSATLTLPTYEDAPDRLAPWLRQRTRWYKGWLQTWLVHTRNPLRLAQELGWRGMLGFAVVCTGLIVSSLVYPIYLATLVVMITDPLSLWGHRGIVAAAVVAMNLFNLVAGYVAMGLLAGRSLNRRGRAIKTRGLLLLPVYWLLMSLASYRAIFELVMRPHHWAKTPHTRHGGADQ
jgi:cellulose synthase/poly-beta-1,6-N-acetylglucosamine synthase-like glycosyltransferase